MSIPAFYLPLPKGGRISHVCHISDLHIRTGESHVARYDEYEGVFKRICAFLDSVPYRDTVVVMITGDVFHNKSTMGPAGNALFSDLVSTLSKIAPVYLTRGNHDYRQDRPCEPDMIGPLLRLIAGFDTNIAYLDDIGYYYANNVGFAIVPIQYTLEAGNTFGGVEELPAFPPAAGMARTVDRRVALFHGSVPQRIPLGWFGDDYDFIMLGDIHKQMVFDHDEEIRHSTVRRNPQGLCRVASFTKKAGKAMWGYPSSTVQQSFGESLLGHGMLMWDMDESSVDMYHVANDFGMVDLYHMNSDWHVNVTHPMDRGLQTMPLSQAVKLSWFPRKINVRLKKTRDLGNDVDVHTQVKGILSLYDITYLSVQNAPFDVDSTATTDDVHHISPLFQQQEMMDVNTPEVWTQFIDESLRNLDIAVPFESWRNWFASPETLVVPPLLDVGNLTLPLQKKIEERNKKIHATIGAYTTSTTQIRAKLRSNSFKILFMSWSYILCFDANCYVDFRCFDRRITCINGVNGAGKTSFLETMCIALFGTSFPSRHNSANSGAIICQKKHDSRPFTSIVVEVDGGHYRIHRAFKTLDDITKVTSCDIVLQKVCYDERQRISFEDVYKGKTAVDTWVRENIGDADAFLLSCVITQTSDSDFFSLKPKEQREKIDNAMALQSTAAFSEVLHAASLAYKDVATDVKTMHSVVVNDEHFFFDTASVDEKRHALDVCLKKLDCVLGTITTCEETLKLHTRPDLLERGSAAIHAAITDCDAELASLDSTPPGSLVSLHEMRGKLQAEFDELKPYFVPDGTLAELESARIALVSTQPPKLEEDNNLADVVASLRVMKTSMDDLGDEHEIATKLQELQAQYLLISDSIHRAEHHLVSLAAAVIEEERAVTVATSVWSDIVQSKPAAPLESKAEHCQWLQDISALERTHVSLEKLEETLQSLVAIDEPEMTQKEVDNAEAKLVKWRSGVIARCGRDVDPFFPDFETKRRDAAAAVTTAQNILLSSDACRLKLQDEVAALEKEMKELVQQRMTHSESMPEKPKYLGKDEERRAAFTEFQMLQQRVDASSLMFVGYDDEARMTLDRSVITNGMRLLMRLEVAEQKLLNNVDMRCDCEDLPFNPQCEACLQQPWRKKVLELEKRIEDARVAVDVIMAEMKTEFGDCVVDASSISEASRRVKAYDTFSVDREKLRGDNEFWCCQEGLETIYGQWDDDRRRLDDAIQFLRVSVSDTSSSLAAHTAECVEFAKNLEHKKQDATLLESVASEYEHEFHDLRLAYERNKESNRRWNEYRTRRTSLEEALRAWRALEAMRAMWDEDDARRDALAKWSSDASNAKTTKERAESQLLQSRASVTRKRECLHQNKMSLASTGVAVDHHAKKLDTRKSLEMKHDELDAVRKKCEAWRSWDLQRDRIGKSIDSFVALAALTACDRDIARATRLDELSLLRTDLDAATKFIQPYEQSKQAKRDMAKLTEERLSLGIGLSSLEKSLVSHREVVSQVDRLSQYITRLDTTRITIDTIERKFGDFKTWVLRTKAIPTLCKNVNNVTQTICANHRPISLHARFNDDGQFSWFIQDGSNMVPLEKASGFQRFAISLGMRIALGKLGVSGISAKQLFIDEGFTACDASNLSSVPDFLTQLVRGAYDGVVIVSHLEELKTTSGASITITRDLIREFSHLSVGTADNPLAEMAKLRGRKTMIVTQM